MAAVSAREGGPACSKPLSLIWAVCLSTAVYLLVETDNTLFRFTSSHALKALPCIKMGRYRFSYYLSVRTYLSTIGNFRFSSLQTICHFSRLLLSILLLVHSEVWPPRMFEEFHLYSGDVLVMKQEEKKALLERSSELLAMLKEDISMKKKREAELENGTSNSHKMPTKAPREEAGTAFSELLRLRQKLSEGSLAHENLLKNIGVLEYMLKQIAAEWKSRRKAEPQRPLQRRNGGY
jgi:hypothetical protein